MVGDTKDEIGKNAFGLMGWGQIWREKWEWPSASGEK